LVKYHFKDIFSKKVDVIKGVGGSKITSIGCYP
jgi:hypothetical protein